MKIKEVDYPIRSKRKFAIVYNGKDYTCYLDCWNGNFVCTGDGNSEKCKNITNTEIGMKIIHECFRRIEAENN